MTNHDALQTAANVVAPISIFVTLLEWLPAVCAIPAAIYYCILLYDRFIKGPK